MKIIKIIVSINIAAVLLSSYTFAEGLLENKRQNLFDKFQSRKAGQQIAKCERFEKVTVKHLGVSERMEKQKIQSDRIIVTLQKISDISMQENKIKIQDKIKQIKIKVIYISDLQNQLLNDLKSLEESICTSGADNKIILQNIRDKTKEINTQIKVFKVFLNKDIRSFVQNL